MEGQWGSMHSQWGSKQRLKLWSCHGEWQSLEQSSEREALGDINQGEVVRETSQLPMAFNPALISLPLNTTAAHIADNDAL